MHHEPMIISYDLFRDIVADEPTWDLHHFAVGEGYRVWVGVSDQVYEALALDNADEGLTDKTHFDANYLSGSTEALHRNDAVVRLSRSEKYHHADALGRTAVTTDARPPRGATPQGVSLIDIVSSDVEDHFVIPDGDILTITRFSGGAEEKNSKTSVAALVWQPNGNSADEVVLRCAYLDGSTVEFDMNRDFVGDGTARITVRRKKLGGGNREIAAFWDGFTVTP